MGRTNSVATNASFGVPYNYSGLSYPESPWLPPVQPIRALVAEYCAFTPNNCLLNWYEDGFSRMGFHSDSTTELVDGSGIAVVSLGAARVMRFRRKTLEDRRAEGEIKLEPGSLLLMTAAMQQTWQHAIPAAEGAKGRISLTFRRLRQSV